MRPELSAALDDLNSTLTTIEKVMDPEEMSARVRELEQQAADPSLWDDPDHAQQVTSELSAVQGKLRKLTDLRQRLEDLPIMYELAEEEGEGDELADEELADMRTQIEALEVQTMLSGDYDQREALINIRSG
ncbi:MAG: PCRF domain-containing protein, partial [Corynebacterium humireducens]|nr:PCRF domain-containing protein [Corynebacterium humireducens]